MLKNRWIIDIGATTHVCSQHELFIDTKDVPTIQDLHGGSGNEATAKKTCTIKLPKHIEMKNVLLCGE